MLASLARRTGPLRASALQQARRSMTVKFSKVRCPRPPALASTAIPRLVASSFARQDHEWVKVEGDVGTIGITDHAQDQLGDVVFVELPEVGASVEQNDTMGAVESVKAASDIYSPVTGEPSAPPPPACPCDPRSTPPVRMPTKLRPPPSSCLLRPGSDGLPCASRYPPELPPSHCAGEIVEVNETLTEEPSLINSGAESDGWMAKIKLTKPAELDGLMVPLPRPCPAPPPLLFPLSTTQPRPNPAPAPRCRVDRASRSTLLQDEAAYKAFCNE